MSEEKQEQFEKDFNKAYSFYLQHKAEIEKIFKQNKLLNIENNSTELARMLDCFAGIDYIVLHKKLKSLFGVASRINFNKNYHKHVTIRYERSTGTKTEYQKRVDAILSKTNQLYASITMQIDSNEDKNKILRAIVFESDKLYIAIHNNMEVFKANYLRECYDGNKFFSIPYEVIQEIGNREDFMVKVIDFEKE
jgi:hypothetical protein